MNRAQFMEELAQLLLDIPQEDRDEALEFYENYFEDAGAENEGAILEELGSPEKLALSIRYNLRDGNEEYAEYTECGYEDTRTREKDKMPDAYTVVGYSRVRRKRKHSFENSEEKFEKTFEQENGKKYVKGNHAKLILAIILMVFLSPVLTGVIGGVFGVVVAVLCVVFAVGFVLPVVGLLVAAVLTFAFAAAGVAVMVVGFPLFFTNAAVGILLWGIGFLLLALMFAGGLIIKWLIKTVLPGSLRCFTEKCSKFFYRFRKEGAK